MSTFLLTLLHSLIVKS